MIREDFNVEDLSFIGAVSEQHESASVSEYGSVDPAPASDSEQLDQLQLHF